MTVKPTLTSRGTSSSSSSWSMTPVVSLFDLTEKTNAPCSGCESAETIRQATVYVPRASGRSPSSIATVCASGREVSARVDALRVRVVDAQGAQTRVHGLVEAQEHAVRPRLEDGAVAWLCLDEDGVRARRRRRGECDEHCREGDGEQLHRPLAQLLDRLLLSGRPRRDAAWDSGPERRRAARARPARRPAARAAATVGRDRPTPARAERAASARGASRAWRRASRPRGAAPGRRGRRRPANGIWTARPTRKTGSSTTLGWSSPEVARSISSRPAKAIGGSSANGANGSTGARRPRPPSSAQPSSASSTTAQQVAMAAGSRSR